MISRTQVLDVAASTTTTSSVCCAAGRPSVHPGVYVDHTGRADVDRSGPGPACSSLAGCARRGIGAPSPRRRSAAGEVAAASWLDQRASLAGRRGPARVVDARPSGVAPPAGVVVTPTSDFECRGAGPSLAAAASARRGARRRRASAWCSTRPTAVAVLADACQQRVTDGGPTARRACRREVGCLVGACSFATSSTTWDAVRDVGVRDGVTRMTSSVRTACRPRRRPAAGRHEAGRHLPRRGVPRHAVRRRARRARSSTRDRRRGGPTLERDIDVGAPRRVHATARVAPGRRAMSGGRSSSDGCSGARGWDGHPGSCGRDCRAGPGRRRAGVDAGSSCSSGFVEFFRHQVPEELHDR